MVLKILEKLNTFVQILKYKIIYRNRIKFGRNINIRGKLYVRIAQNAKIIIGNNCFFNNNCSINCKSEIIIGSDCLFGENVKFYDHDHIFNHKGLIRNNGYNTGKIKIGNNVWLCSDVIILRGSTIGDNCVIGAKEIIKKSVNSNCIVVNNESKNIIIKE